MALRADQKGIELLCDISAEVSELVQGDSARLRQVVLNLVENAIKFTHAGEVALQVQVESRNQDIQLIHFSVRDTGIGIPPERRESIFNPFTQVDSSTTRKYGGTGLGLTISARLVSMMGGRIWLESEIGRGTTFHFTAPLKTLASQVASDVPISATDLRAVRALIVDDNATNRKILRGMLASWNIRTDEAEDGTRALRELLSAQQVGDAYRLVLSDMHMPDMSGFEFVEQVRRDPALVHTPIMMLSSAGQIGDAERSLRLCIASYLIKPVRKRELLASVEKTLGERHESSPAFAVKRGSPHAADHHLHILVAEDNRVNQIVATRTLQKMGHSVVLAENGKTPLRSWRRRPSTWCSWIFRCPRWTDSPRRGTSVSRSREAKHTCQLSP